MLFFIPPSLKRILFVFCLCLGACQSSPEEETEEVLEEEVISNEKEVVEKPDFEEVLETNTAFVENSDPEFEAKTLGENPPKPTPVKPQESQKEVEKVVRIEEEPAGVKTKKEYDQTLAFHRGRAVVIKDGKYGYIDTDGYEIVPPKYDYAESFTESYGLARVRIRDKVGFINFVGKEVVPLKYRYVEKFVNGLAHARMADNTQFYINFQGEKVGEILDKYYEGIARIRMGDKIGYVNDEGQLLTPIAYEYGTHFENSRAEVKQDGRHFYINRAGKCIENCPN